MRIIERKIVAALIVTKDNKYLFGRKDPKQGGVYTDCWQMPGGGIDKGETQHQALIREVFEEVGIDISNGKIELVDDSFYDESKKTLRDTGEKVLCKMFFNDYLVMLNLLSDELNPKAGDDFCHCQWLEKKRFNIIKSNPTVN